MQRQESDREDARIVGGLRFRLLIDHHEVAEAVDRVAAMIAPRYHDLRPVLLCVLNGGALFHADLIRRLRFPLEVDYLRVASYHGGMVSSQRINFTAEPGTQMEGRYVIVVEDIVDSGRTIERLRDYCLERGARGVEVASLLFKPDAHTEGRAPEYVGIEIPDSFVVGYGLDYRQEGRNLDAIYVLDSTEH